MRYGRCMSKQELSELRKTGVLQDHGNGLVPVFNSPYAVEDRLRRMSRNDLSDYFRRIGVRGPQRIVFFETDALDGIVGPIPVKNGLMEYRFPEGRRVKLYDTIRV